MADSIKSSLGIYYFTCEKSYTGSWLDVSFLPHKKYKEERILLGLLHEICLIYIYILKASIKSRKKILRLFSPFAHALVYRTGPTNPPIMQVRFTMTTFARYTLVAFNLNYECSGKEVLYWMLICYPCNILFINFHFDSFKISHKSRTYSKLVD